jgi:hypothetical protein
MSLRRTSLAFARLTLLVAIGLRIAGTHAGATVSRQTIIVTDVAELEAALTPDNAGRDIVVRAGTYDLSHALTVPDGASVIGEGDMVFDASGLPWGFDPAGLTVLRSTAALAGDILTLGHGASLRNLSIEDVFGRPGNLVLVSSRSPGDFVSATLAECELINPNGAGVLPSGPSGRAVLVLSNNRSLGGGPPPDEGAQIQVSMSRTIIRSLGGGQGLFAANFAANSRVVALLSDNVIGGGLDLVGGVSRPDPVQHAETIIVSEHNLYRSDSPSPSSFGWSLTGGSDAPVPGVSSQANASNVLRLHSVDDRVEGFVSALVAVAGRRHTSGAAAISGNRIDLQTLGTRLRSLRQDLGLFGARSVAAGVPPDDGNVVQVVARGVEGSGPRANEYFDSWSAAGSQYGQHNALRIVGSLQAFEAANTQIEGLPGSRFFVGRQ